MNHFLKGAAVVAVVLIISMAIHVFCNLHDIPLDPVVASTMSSVCSMLLYRGLIRIEKK